MSTISTDTVRSLATLSALDLSQAELATMTVELESIIANIEALGELGTEGVEPTYQVTALSNVWRQDQVEESEVSREDLLALAPQQAASQIKVPKVL